MQYITTGVLVATGACSRLPTSQTLSVLGCHMPKAMHAAASQTRTGHWNVWHAFQSRHAWPGAGDAAAAALLERLLRAGCAPYFRALERWLCEGTLDDPFAEFMVEEDMARPRP